MTTVEIVTIAADTGWPGEAGLAHGLERRGLPVRGCRVVGPDDGAVERALRQAVEGGGLIVVPGDGEEGAIARRALARVLGARLVLSSRALEALEAASASREQALPRRAEALALVPIGATVIVPQAGGEPGLLAETAGALVALVPVRVSAALALIEEHVVPRLSARDASPVIVTRTLRLVGLDRAEAEAGLGAAIRGVEGVSAHVVAADGEVRVRLRLRGPTAAAAGAVFGALEPALRLAFGTTWYGEDEEPLETVVGRLLRARGWTVALAESCTGGLVGHRLTQVAGSSTYFERGFVVYSNAAKQALLGVPEAVLVRHGAVSRECAGAMAAGARERAGTDLGLSITGIAGPDGGTPTKPVGTVFIGLADASTVTVERHRFDGDRAGNKALAATHALDFLRRRCLGGT